MFLHIFSTSPDTKKTQDTQLYTLSDTNVRFISTLVLLPAGIRVILICFIKTLNLDMKLSPYL